MCTFSISLSFSTSPDACLNRSSLISYPTADLIPKSLTAVVKMRPSPQPRSQRTSSLLALATSSIFLTTSCGDDTNGAQLMKLTLQFELKPKHDSSYFNSPSRKMLSSIPSWNCKPLSQLRTRVLETFRYSQCFRYRTLITFDYGEAGRDELGVSRRKERLSIKSPGDGFEPADVQTRQRHDPQELKIYI